MSRSRSRWLIGSTLLLGVGGFIWLRLEATPDWSMAPHRSLPQPNGYDLYVAAAAALVPANPAVDPVQDRAPVTAPKLMAQRYSLARRTAWIAQNARAWELIEQARAAESVHPSERMGIWRVPKNMKPLRDVARGKIAVANVDKRRGDWNKAAKEELDIIEMGGDLARGGSYLSYLVGISIEGIGIVALADTPGHLNGQEARAAAARLEKLMPRRASLVEALREEKWEGMAKMRDFLAMKQWRLSISALSGSKKVTMEEAFKNLFLSQREVVENYSRVADWNIARVQQPYSSSAVGMPQVGPHFDTLLDVDTTKARFFAARSDTNFSLLLIRLALRAYRFEKGSYPATLAELAPIYLAKVPLDPFGNNTPLHYQRQGDSYLLWSIGPDMTDNKGTTIPGKKFTATIQNSRGDVVARPEEKSRYVF